jgi:thiamine-phosphate pyrophosphorylase
VNPAVARPLIMLVTDRARAGARFLDIIHDAARAGVTLVQVRESGLSDRALVVLTRDVVRAVAGTRAQVVVNDRVDVALAAGAAGVHLRGDSVDAPRVRRLAPPPFLIGRSVHAVDEAVAVERAGGCDYLVFGTVFASASKPAGHQHQGTAELRRVCAAVALPVLAIGGIAVEHAPEIAAAGAAGVAAIGLFATTDDLPRTLAALRASFDSPSGLA